MITSQKMIQELLQYSHSLQVRKEAIERRDAQVIKAAEILLLQESEAFMVCPFTDMLVGLN